MAAGSGEEYGMITYTIYVNDNHVKDHLGNLARRSNVVIYRAANDSISTARKVIAHETYERNALLYGDIRKTLKVTRATRMKPYAILRYNGDFMNLAIWKDRHGPSVVKPYYPHVGWSDDPENYFAHVKRKGGNKALVGSDPIPFVQIAKKSGNVSLFTRVGKDRYPMRGVAAPAIPQVIKDESIMDKMAKETGKKLVKRLQHYISAEFTGIF